jgi:hypothetical protein
MSDRGRERWEGKDLEELLSDLLTVAEVDSLVHRQIRAAIDVKIAELNREAAHDGLRWAQLAAISTMVATAIALAAFLVAVL